MAGKDLPTSTQVQIIELQNIQDWTWWALFFGVHLFYVMFLSSENNQSKWVNIRLWINNFCVLQWCNGDRWQGWQLSGWKANRNCKLSGMFCTVVLWCSQMLFHFSVSCFWIEHLARANCFFLCFCRKMSLKTRMPRWSKSLAGRWPLSCTCSS